MRALLCLVALAAGAHAERRINDLTNPIRGRSVQRGPLVWHDMPAYARRSDAGAIQIGRGIATGWRHDMHVGFHPTDRWLIRVREHVVAREVEAAYTLVDDTLELQNHDQVPLELFVLVGAGTTNDRDATAHAGIMLRTRPVGGADWVALEVGARLGYGDASRVFAAMSLLLSRRSIRSLRSLVSL